MDSQRTGVIAGQWRLRSSAGRYQVPGEFWRTVCFAGDDAVEGGAEPCSAGNQARVSRCRGVFGSWQVAPARVYLRGRCPRLSAQSGAGACGLRRCDEHRTSAFVQFRGYVECEASPVCKTVGSAYVTISSTSRDQAIFVDHATGASLLSYAVLAENDRLW